MKRERKSSKPSPRSRSLVTHDSMREWLERPEWAYLLDLLTETAEEASVSLLSADSNDASAVARAQAEVRYLQHFTNGDVADAMTEELKEKKEV